jgi:protein-tyrosine-phosphatase
MKELGIDLAHKTPTRLTHELAQQADLVITMGCGDECPSIPGKQSIDWDLPDPANQPIDTVRIVRDEIDQRIRTLVAELDG